MFPSVLAYFTRGTNARMDSRPSLPRGRILFTVREDARFSGALWDRFRAVVAARNEGPWIAVLRGLIERYVRDHETENP
jgi:hypothetical protein